MYVFCEHTIEERPELLNKNCALICSTHFEMNRKTVDIAHIYNNERQKRYKLADSMP